MDETTREGALRVIVRYSSITCPSPLNNHEKIKFKEKLIFNFLEVQISANFPFLDVVETTREGALRVVVRIRSINLDRASGMAMRK